MKALALALAATLVPVVPAAAQDTPPDGAREPWRTRVIVGPMAAPRFPGSDKVNVLPYFDFSRTRGDTPFEFEAPDESTSFSLIDNSGFAVGPVVGFEGKRRRRDVGGLNEVGFSVELGGFVHAYLTDNIRLRGEVRQGVSGHRGLIGVVGADFVAREDDKWLFSIGPRVTLADGKYNRAYFGVSPAETARTGVATYNPGGGVQAIGGTASVLREIGPRWTLFGFAKYDRLIDDAANSPVTRLFGSRNQISGGVGIGYTFGRGVR